MQSVSKLLFKTELNNYFGKNFNSINLTEHGYRTLTIRRRDLALLNLLAVEFGKEQDSVTLVKLETFFNLHISAYFNYPNWLIFGISLSCLV